MLIDRYICLEWLKVFLLCLLVVLGLLLLSDIQNDLQDLLGFGASAEEIIRYYWIRLPGFLPVVLPMTFMISLLFVLGQLHRNHETTAVLAAGISMWRMTRSLWVAGALLTVSLFYLNAQLVPRAIESSRDFWNDIAFRHAMTEATPANELGMVYNLTFTNRKDHRLWFINRFSEFDFQAHGITISMLAADDGRELQRIVANRGFYDDLARTWQLQSGRQMSFDPASGELVRSLPFDQLVLENYDEDPNLMKYLEKRPKDLSVRELDRVIRYLDPHDDPRVAAYAVAFYDRLFSPLSCLIILGLAIPFSTMGVRVNPFVGISKAMGWLIAYLLLVNVAQVVGASGWNPLLVAALPNIAAVVVVAHYMNRMRHPA